MDEGLYFGVAITSLVLSATAIFLAIITIMLSRRYKKQSDQFKSQAMKSLVKIETMTTRMAIKGNSGTNKPNNIIYKADKMSVINVTTS